MRPRCRILRIVARIERCSAGAGNRKLAARDVALVGELEQRALGAGQVGKFRGGELDEWDVAGVRERIGAVRYGGSAQKKRPCDGER